MSIRTRLKWENGLTPSTLTVGYNPIDAAAYRKEKTVAYLLAIKVFLNDAMDLNKANGDTKKRLGEIFKLVQREYTLATLDDDQPEHE